MKRILTLLLCIVLITGTQATLAYAAPEWPSNVSVEAEGAVLMDARSGAVIYGKICIPFTIRPALPRS